MKLEAKVFVVGNNNCWGSGETLSEAHKNANKPKKYIAYLAPKDTLVEGFDGSLSYPRKAFIPVVIERKGIKKKETEGEV